MRSGARIHPAAGFSLTYDPSSSALMFTGIYAIVALCLVMPPPAFVGLGLTVPTLFASALGIERQSFIQYHMKRTTITLAFHGSILLVYVALMLVSVLDAEEASSNWVLRTGLLLISTAGAGMVLAALYWRGQGDWQFHPLSRRLRAFNPEWREVAISINHDLHREEDLLVSTVGGSKVVISDNWILRCSAYRLDLAHQHDSDIAIESSTFVRDPNAQAREPLQILTLRVTSVSRDGSTDEFLMKLRSSDYERLVEKVQRGVRNAGQVTVENDLGDRFLDALRAVVEENAPHELEVATAAEEQCVGCWSTAPNVKIASSCGSAATCPGSCFCRPMWCLGCLCRWFVSKQPDVDPARWMSGTAPCPTCRKRFCVFDISPVVIAGAAQAAAPLYSVPGDGDHSAEQPVNQPTSPTPSPQAHASATAAGAAAAAGEEQSE